MAAGESEDERGWLQDTDPGIRLKQHIHANSKAAREILDEQARRHGEGFGS